MNRMVTIQGAAGVLIVEESQFVAYCIKIFEGDEDYEIEDEDRYYMLEAAWKSYKKDLCPTQEDTVH